MQYDVWSCFCVGHSFQYKYFISYYMKKNVANINLFNLSQNSYNPLLIKIFEKSFMIVAATSIRFLGSFPLSETMAGAWGQQPPHNGWRHNLNNAVTMNDVIITWCYSLWFLIKVKYHNVQWWMVPRDILDKFYNISKIDICAIKMGLNN